MLKLIFEYFDKNNERTMATVHGRTTEEAMASAYKWALANGDGDFSPMELWNMSASGMTQLETPKIEVTL